MARREQTGEDISFCNECIRKEYPFLSDIKVHTVNIGISSRTELDIGGVRLELYPMDSIHTRDAMLIYAPDEKSLFIGDADGEDHYELNGRMDPQRISRYMEFVKDLDFEHYLLGHDTPDTKEGVMKYLRDSLKKYGQD